MDRLNALMVTALAMGACPVSLSSSNKTDQPIKGHICGRDNGRGKKRIDRNSVCDRGCGRKAKKCPKAGAYAEKLRLEALADERQAIADRRKAEAAEQVAKHKLRIDDPVAYATLYGDGTVKGSDE